MINLNIFVTHCKKIKCDYCLYYCKQYRNDFYYIKKKFLNKNVLKLNLFILDNDKLPSFIKPINIECCVYFTYKQNIINFTYQNNFIQKFYDSLFYILDNF